MELLNPRITITNATDGFWLVGFRHEFDAHQIIDISVQIPKMPTSPTQDVIRAAIARMQELLQKTDCC